MLVKFGQYLMGEGDPMEFMQYGLPPLRLNFWEIAIPAIASIAGGLLAGKKKASPAEQEQAQLLGVQSGIATDQHNLYKDIYEPNERQLADEVKNAGSPEEQEAAAGRSAADVTQAFDAQRGIATRNLSRYSPTSGISKGMMLELDAAEAATKAGGMNFARETEKDKGFSKRFGIAELGRNLPSTAMTGLASAASQYGIAANRAYDQDRTRTQDIARGIAPLASAAGKWLDTKSSNTPSYGIDDGTMRDIGLR